MIKIIITLLTLFSFNIAQAKEVSVGIILGFTGPIESLTPDMSAGAELAFKEASDSGNLLNGCLLYTSPSPRDLSTSRMPSSA